MLPPMTKKELAEVAGYSYRRLHDIDKEHKLFLKSENGKYDLAFFVQAWVQYNVDGKNDDEEKTLDDVKAEHEAVKIRKTQLEVAKLEGRYVDVTEIRRIWANIAATVTQALLLVPSKIAPVLVMQKDADIISGMIDREIRAVLNSIADTPLPDDAEINDEGEEESEGDE